MQTIQQEDPFIETRFQLEQWAIWSRRNVLFLGYKTNLHQVNASHNARSCNACSINDDQAMQIDAALSDLIIKFKRTGEITRDYFLCGCNYSVIAEQYEIDRKKISNIVGAGIAWIDAYLFSAT